jgi:hypothetical protein
VFLVLLWAAEMLMLAQKLFIWSDRGLIEATTSASSSCDKFGERRSTCYLRLLEVHCAHIIRQDVYLNLFDLLLDKDDLFYTCFKNMIPN